MHDMLLGLLLRVLVARAKAPLLEQRPVDDRVDRHVDGGRRERQARREDADLVRPTTQRRARAVLQDALRLGEVRREVREGPRGKRRRRVVRE